MITVNITQSDIDNCSILGWKTPLALALQRKINNEDVIEVSGGKVWIGDTLYQGINKKEQSNIDAFTRASENWITKWNCKPRTFRLRKIYGHSPNGEGTGR